LKRCGIHWNRLGQSKGTADVEFFYSSDAIRARDRYNSKHFIKNKIKIIDNTIAGVPIRIEISRTNREDRVSNRKLDNRIQRRNRGGRFRNKNRNQDRNNNFNRNK
jgi:hypothetical protein